MLKQHIPNWRKVLNHASIQLKQMMFRTIIEGIGVRRDGSKIQFKLRISQFIDTMSVDIGDQVDADKVTFLIDKTIKINSTRPI
ncbi:hypothetical protein ABEX47_23570 [Paenibacillus ehimensis]|uniref:hypothetical protein n=1 Tax=Paenibacillus ehimensis TaxID=79264 RepID=UPI003D2B17B7